MRMRLFAVLVTFGCSTGGAPADSAVADPGPAEVEGVGPAEVEDVGSVEVEDVGPVEVEATREVEEVTALEEVADAQEVADDAPVPPPPEAPPHPISIRGWSPFAEVSAFDADPIACLLDTGAPVTALDTDWFGGPAGPAVASVALFGDVLEHEVVRYDLFGSVPEGAIQTVGGIVGADMLLLRGFRVDYRAQLAWVDDGIPVGGAAALEAIVAPVILAGGGTFGVPGDGSSKPFGATRLLVDAVVEGIEIVALVDTGATHTVLHPDVFEALPEVDRPTLGGVSVSLHQNKVEATLSRVATLAVGDASVTGADVMILPVDVFSAVQLETDAPVQALLGGTWLRWFRVGIASDALTLEPYETPDHVPANEWIGPGLTVGDGPNGDFYVTDVYAGTDAEAQGIAAGFLLAALFDEPVSAWSLADFRAHLHTFEPGTTLELGFRATDGSVIDVPVLSEDLLPALD